MKLINTRTLVPLLPLLLASGCAVGPNYRMPATAVPNAFANGIQTNLSSRDTVITWWHGFQDTRLNELIAHALTNNQDLRIATANLREARALRQISVLNLLPIVPANAGYTQARISQAAAPYLPSNLLETGLYDAGFDATWELDVFGRVRRTIEASTADVQAAEANRRDVQVSLISEIARNYFELRGAQNELAVARSNAENQHETVSITQARLDGGRGTELDVARARTQWSATLAVIPPIETAIAQSIHRLGVLCGQQPTALIAELQPPEPLPPLPALIAISSPEALLRRRADVRAAERGLAATTARIGVATADLFPRVTFNGTVSLQATSIADLGKSGNDAYSFGPRISWAAFDLGRVRARIQASGARADAALATYERTVLTALEETENALVFFGREQIRRDYLHDSVVSSETAAKLARQRYEAGATDFLTVLDAERAWLIARDQFARSQTSTATALVAVYKALGGGWETPSNPPPNSAKL